MADGIAARVCLPSSVVGPGWRRLVAKLFKDARLDRSLPQAPHGRRRYSRA